jgi:AcrR family transcriptional regulator
MPKYANSRLKAAVHQIRREEIESAALRVVCKHGFPASSLRMVARQAKVPLSILHYYFKDKDELMQCVVRRLFDGMLRAFDRIRASEPDPVKRIERLLETYLTRSTEEWQASLAFIEYWAACVRAGTVEKFYAQVQFRYSEPMAEALREAGAEDPEQLARALLALMTGYDTFYWSKPADIQERSRFLEFARTMVRRAIARGRSRVKLVGRNRRKDKSFASVPKDGHHAVD